MNNRIGSRLVYLLIMLVILSLLGGCFKLFLFQYPINEVKFECEKKRPEIEKYGHLVRHLELKQEGIKQLRNKNKRPIDKYRDPTSSRKEFRLYRKDLHDEISKEWKQGWEYLSKADLEEEASGIEGNNGIIVPESALGHTAQNFTATDCEPKNTAILRFIHLSDVQLRDETVYMFDEELLDLLDYLAHDFQHEPDLVFYDQSYYMTLIGMINLIYHSPDLRPKPKFMIHTGDSLHMGVVSEAYNFIQITNELEIPWFNALGNHDYTVYGNLESRNVGVIDPDMLFQTISSKYNYINMHGKGFYIDSDVYFSPKNAPHKATISELESVYNGFDMIGGGFNEAELPPEELEKVCAECPGYYHFEAVEPNGVQPGVLILVLDTSVKDQKIGAKGELSKEQRIWIKHRLDEYSEKENWMVLAFGHHPLSEKYISKGSKEIIKLFTNPKYNVVSYFCGHTHKNRIIYHKNSENDQFGFWEIIANSIQEYPKKGSVVNVVCNERKNWELRLQSFWPYFLKGEIDEEDPVMIKNAKKCYESSKKDNNSLKKKYYEALNVNQHDTKLPFSLTSN